MRTSFHHQPEAQHPNFPPSTSRQADYLIFTPKSGQTGEGSTCPLCANSAVLAPQQFRQSGRLVGISNPRRICLRTAFADQSGKSPMAPPSDWHQSVMASRE